MCIDFFRVDWVFWDTIIIILLIIFLVSVKIFKYTHRWRKSLSNSDVALQKNKDFTILNVKNEDYKCPFIIFYKKSTKTKEKKSTKTLLIFNNNISKVFPYAEALASIGINTVIIPTKKIKKIQENITKKIKLNTFLIEEFSKTICSHLEIPADSLKNIGNILIFQKVLQRFLPNYSFTPHFNKYFFVIDNFEEKLKSLLNFFKQINFDKDKLFLIFPLKKLISKTVDSNKTAETIINKDLINKKNILHLNESRKSLKNYETIVIGFISTIILKNNQ